MLTQQEFVAIVESLELPVGPGGAGDLGQHVRWRSLQRARLLAAVRALQPHAHPDIRAVFAATTPGEIYDALTRTEP